MEAAYRSWLFFDSRSGTRSAEQGADFTRSSAPEPIPISNGRSRTSGFKQGNNELRAWNELNIITTVIQKKRDSKAALKR
jgi:hypothetical protein